MSEDCIGNKVKEEINALQDGNILLLQNQRFYKGEKTNDENFVNELIDTVQPELYVNDAFGTAHRPHASVIGVPKKQLKGHENDTIPLAVPGFLMTKEIIYQSCYIPIKENRQSNSKKVVSIVGGAKVGSKVPIIQNLLQRVDKVLIGGAMAMPFIQAKGYTAGKLIEGDAAVDLAKKILQKAEEENVEIVLPIDFLTANKVDKDEKTVPYNYDELPSDVYAQDIGKKSIELFSKELNDCGVCIWNGPLGLFEWDAYCHGTFEIAKTVSKLTENNGLISIAGGGETSQALEDVYIRDGTAVKFTHISTGGGASLEMLEGKQLPAFTVFRAL